MTPGAATPLSDPLSDGVELATLRGQVAMVKPTFWRVRAARDHLAAEVEQLRVTCQYQEDLSPRPATGVFRYDIQID